MTGVLYGVGVGPGDPELMTLKAVRVIGAADLVAYPAPERGESSARRIAAGAIRPGAEELAIRIPMRPGPWPAHEIYDAAAARLAPALAAGRSVAVLCEGDPFFYGSFMYLYDRLAGSAPVEVIPGVTSLTACAAAAGQPLCRRAGALAVLPGTLEDAALALRLRPGEAAAILKVGRHLGRLRALLTRLGRDAVYVAHASRPEAAVLPLAEAPDPAPYFSMLLVVE